jgi:acetyl esterase/lipase
MDICYPLAAPKSPSPAIVLIHGGGWTGGDRTDVMKSMTDCVARGYFCASVGYRFSQVAIFPAQIHDCKCAIRYLRAHAREYNLDADRIGAVGWSAGGHLAALLGTSGGVPELEGDGGWPGVDSRVQAVCDYFGPADFPAWAADKNYGSWGKDAKNALYKLFGGPIPQKLDLARKASPVTWVSKDDPPFLIIHGTADDIVPYGQSVRLRDELRKAGVPVELITVKDGDHGGWKFWSGPWWEKEAAFFSKNLKERK